MQAMSLDGRWNTTNPNCNIPLKHWEERLLNLGAMRSDGLYSGVRVTTADQVTYDLRSREAGSFEATSAIVGM